MGVSADSIRPIQSLSLADQLDIARNHVLYEQRLAALADREKVLDEKLAQVVDLEVLHAREAVAETAIAEAAEAAARYEAKLAEIAFVATASIADLDAQFPAA